MDVRLARARPETDRPYAPVESEFRSDLERIRFARSFSRLAEVTQVVSAGATSGVVHNRLTHTIKVTAVARAIAVRLLQTEDRELLARLGGLDHVVVQAAASAHDLGHPPFGHLGERVLDRLARERFGLTDGFEGNAQTFRVITEIEVHGPGDVGLNLTAAVRAAVLKYPWARTHYPEPHPTDWPTPARGAGQDKHGLGAAKFSCYLIDLPEMLDALRAFPELPPGRQTLECSVMDLADDIAYSLHDVEDFHRSGVLQFSPVSAEFRSWASDRKALAGLDDRGAGRRRPSAGRRAGAAAPPSGLPRHLDLRRGHLRRRGGPGRRGVRGRRAGPALRRVDGRRPGRHRLQRDLDRRADRRGRADSPSRRCARATSSLSRPAWHQVSVLKFVNQYFILERPDLAMLQRGQEQTVEQLVVAFDRWLADRGDAVRAPRRLVDLVEAATRAYARVAREHPDWLAGRTSAADLTRMGRGRGIIDYVSSLTDAQAVAYAARLSGASGLLWTTGGL